jgi:hypothetical protein
MRHLPRFERFQTDRVRIVIVKGDTDAERRLWENSRVIATIEFVDGRTRRVFWEKIPNTVYFHQPDDTVVGDIVETRTLGDRDRRLYWVVTGCTDTVVEVQRCQNLDKAILMQGRIQGQL